MTHWSLDLFHFPPPSSHALFHSEPNQIPWKTFTTQLWTQCKKPFGETSNNFKVIIAYEENGPLGSYVV
jgi:hypothetical protein